MVNGKQKGKKGELEVAKIFKDNGFKNTRRSQQYSGDKKEGDPDIKGVDGLHIEVKRREKLNIENAIKQVKKDKKDDDIGIIVHRKNREDYKVTLSVDDFFKIFKEYNKNTRVGD